MGCAKQYDGYCVGDAFATKELVFSMHRASHYPKLNGPAASSTNHHNNTEDLYVVREVQDDYLSPLQPLLRIVTYYFWRLHITTGKLSYS